MRCAGDTLEAVAVSVDGRCDLQLRKMGEEKAEGCAHQESCLDTTESQLVATDSQPWNHR